MIRALEVYEISGKPISSFHNEKNLKNDYQILKFGLRTERHILYNQINKRVDLIIKAFNKLELPLIIVGDGPERKRLKKIANNNIIFKNNISNKNIEKLMSTCRGFVYAGVEDFGIAPVEALASGSPVIAFAKGGLLDTITCINNCPKDKVATGLLFKKQNLKHK